MQNILDKFYTAEEPEIPVAEQELLGGALTTTRSSTRHSTVITRYGWIMSINKDFADIVHNSLGDVDEMCDDILFQEKISR